MIKNSKRFYLKSADRLSGTDSSNVLLNVDIPTNEVFTHVCVLDMNIPKCYYLVPAPYNTFVLQELGVNTTITVPPGNYNVSSFRTVLTTLLNAASPNHWVYAISYPNRAIAADTGLYTYSVTGNTGQPSFIVTTNLYEQLGFPTNSTNTFVASSLTSANVLKFQSEDALYLHSDITADGKQGILQEIYTAGVSDFSIINYKCWEWQTMAKPLSNGGSNIFNFNLTDEFARPISLNGQEWVMTLLIFSTE